MIYTSGVCLGDAVDIILSFVELYDLHNIRSVQFSKSFYLVNEASLNKGKLYLL